MTRFGMVVALLITACESKTPRYEGELRVQLGDCAAETAWVSGPRPLPPETPRVAKTEDPPPPADDEDPAIARQQAIEAARQAGILGPTNLQQGGAFASLTGTGDISSGFDDTNIYGGLLGSADDDLRSGFGPGGGGTGWGTIGTGRYGTIGQGTGTGGYGVGGGRGGMRGRTSQVPTVSIGQPNAQGDLDKAIIRRYIKRNIQKIQYCYEKELLAKSNLSGTVMMQFFIGPDGTVKSSTGAGVDPEVSNCVANVIKGIEFPKPKGGGGVQVNYPFTFRPAGATTATTPPPVPADPPKVDPPKVDPPKVDPPATPAGGKRTGPARYTPGANSPLISQRDAFEECFRTNPKPYGAVTVKLDWTGSAVTSAEVHGVSEGVAKCVASAAMKITRTGGDAKSQTCPVAFGDMPVADLPSIEITAESIKYDGVPIADVRAIDPAERMFKIDALYAKIEADVKRERAVTAPITIVGPRVVRPVDTTSIEVVNRVLTTILAGGGDYVLAASKEQSWRMLNLVSVPVVPVPRGTGGGWSVRKSLNPRFDDESVKLSILVQADRIWVGLSRVNEFQEIPALANKQPDLEKLTRTLKEHKASAFFADRRDIEIAGERVTYLDVVRAIDIARDAGFIDFTMSDPTGLAARPTL